MDEDSATNAEQLSQNKGRDQQENSALDKFDTESSEDGYGDDFELEEGTIKVFQACEKNPCTLETLHKCPGCESETNNKCPPAHLANKLTDHQVSSFTILGNERRLPT